MKRAENDYNFNDDAALFGARGALSRRREAIIAVILLAIVAITVVIFLLLPKRHTATATIEFILPIRAHATGNTTQTDKELQKLIKSQIPVISSAVVLDKVITGDLPETIFTCEMHPELILKNPPPGGMCPVDDCRMRLVRKSISVHPEWKPLNILWAERDGKELPYSIEETRAKLLNNLTLRHPENTGYLEITYRSKLKNEAVDIANMIAGAYSRHIIIETERSLSEGIASMTEQEKTVLEGKTDNDGRIIEKGLIQLEEELTKKRREIETNPDAGETSRAELAEIQRRVNEKRKVYEDISKRIEEETARLVTPPFSVTIVKPAYY